MQSARCLPRVMCGPMRSKKTVSAWAAMPDRRPAVAGHLVLWICNPRFVDALDARALYNHLGDALDAGKLFNDRMPL